jgi:hypothetical protein
MLRKCSCGNEVDNDLLVACPKCHRILNDGQKPVSTLSGEEKKEIVNSLRKEILRFFFGGFSVLTVISVILLLVKFHDAYKSGMEKVETIITQRIADEFKDANITQRVQKAAEAQASHLLSEEINPQIEIFRSRIDSSLTDIQTKSNQINDILAQAQNNVDEVKRISDFNLLVSRATNDDREAFDNLVVLSKDGTFTLADLAGKSYHSILMQEDGKLFIPRSDLHFKDGVDPENITIDELIHSYWNTDSKFFTNPVMTRVNLLGYIWKRDNYSKLKKMEFMLQVLSNDTSIRCVYYAEQYFNEEAHLNFDALTDLDKYKEWWSANKNKYN